MTEIEVKNLCKTINKNMVLDNINVHMVSGQVYGVQGINESTYRTYTSYKWQDINQSEGIGKGYGFSEKYWIFAGESNVS